jgi:hypothetical protein
MQPELFIQRFFIFFENIRVWLLVLYLNRLDFSAYVAHFPSVRPALSDRYYGLKISASSSWASEILF